ncbi:DEAD/DEAH box helicase [Cobetia sp. UCD-24C]|uniref:DEAD/DEAH box helicase n=1 Tax=Cobetia sp. UCD-24C TaxID=1716176 RepID=UPI0006CA0251|nr:ATP-binding domain-containing protein [Cobetia sp. UCD-24C]KPM81500.1 helicase [Cobetia sp. UCD-24C]
MAECLSITRGANKKPVCTDILVEALKGVDGLDGEVFTGYPIIATPEGKLSIDATLVSPNKGIILFDLIEGTDVGGYHDRQDDIANKVEAKLKIHRDLMKGRNLLVPLHIISFAPSVNNLEAVAVDGYECIGEAGLEAVLNNIVWDDAGEDLYRMTLSAIESLSSIRKSRSKREIKRPDSRGAKLKALEDSIATLDHRQNKAVIETVDGVQRIRGLAGSGKTIVLALKAAYLHTQYPNWRIAVTFNTRSLKAQIKRLINNFCIEQSGEEPDWSKIRIVNAWGAPGGDARDGIYYEFCRASGCDFLDFRSASSRFGGNDKAFDGACQQALSTKATEVELYDVILADEAQDFAPSFLKLCYAMLKPPKRLVYAYDELQNLSGISLLPPEELFGYHPDGSPLVTFGDDRKRDVILQKCYRNSRPILVAAHGLGFGIYRKPSTVTDTGLVQMFDYPLLWQEIGYQVNSGQLSKGSSVVLKRTSESSPEFLEKHSPVDDIISFFKFQNEQEQNAWLAAEIKKNLEEDELRHDDIVVIHPDPISARRCSGPIRKQLFDAGIQTHLAGVDTDADVFFKTGVPSVTFTGIYRAKGNEAGMVYVINAQDCNASGAGLSSLRNRLFTAMTRSKAWVRVIGHGDKMQGLIDEFSELKGKGFELDFVYPDDALLSKLKVVHRDLSPQERERFEKTNVSFKDAIANMENGGMSPEDIDEETRKRLLKLLGVEK